MMKLHLWETWPEGKNFNSLLDRFSDPLSPTGTAILGHNQRSIPVDVYETEKSIVVEASVPGFSANEVELTITGKTLAITGQTKQEGQTEQKDYYQKERRRGYFERTVDLPGQLMTGGTKASLENGLLTILIPKSEESRSKVIPIQTSALPIGIE